MPKKDDNFTMHVVSHTHWDREWRYPFQEFRLLLLDMFDKLIELGDTNPDYNSFLLDSQTMPLDDYLEIKPEKEADLRRLVKSGKLIIGPWYSLPDTITISGESVVGNLLRGMQQTEEWEGKKWCGYSPCGYGQSSQMPQIYQGFGLDHLFFYRGSANYMTKHEWIWEGADGSRIMGMRSVNPYGRANWYVQVYRPVALNKWAFEWDYNWSEGQLPFHPCDEELADFDYWLLDGKHTEKLYLENLPKALEDIKGPAVKDATCQHLLYMDGMDQVNPYPRTPEIVAEANKLNTGDTYLHSSFYDYVQAVKANAKDLKVVSGEFRYTMKDGMWQNLFPGMLCSRMYLKQQNRQVEYKLQKNADTWAALAATLGAEYPTGLMRQAWKYLLQNQSHDSISGCSVDQVHDDVEYRNRQVRNLADNCSRKAMGDIVRGIDNSALPKDAVCLLAFNPTQYQRSEVVNAVIDVPVETDARWFTLEDTDGNELPVQFIQDGLFGPMVKNPYEFPIPYKARRFQVALQVQDVPGLGYKTFVVKPQSGQKVNFGTLSPAINVLENEFLRAEIQPDGRIDMTNKVTGKVYPGQHYFLDGSDVGDATTQRPTALDQEISSIGNVAEIAKITDGPLMVQYQIKVTMMLPKDAARDESQRNPEKVAYPITTTVTLRKGAKCLEFRTELTNTVKDHKLRAMFPSHYPGVEKAFAETHFAVTDRNIKLPDTSTWKEPMRPEYPQYMFCGVEGKKDGLALINIGLPEYAVYDDETRTIGLSLVRTYRFPIIGADPEDVAVDETQVGTQCLRLFVFDYALYPYGGNWEKGGVYEQASRFNVKMRLNQAGRSTGTLPNTLSFIDV
ncbi:hypothetical protein KAH55_02120, partial [bacterium]|nr:hypothetical protein [bacterium]